MLGDDFKVGYWLARNRAKSSRQKSRQSIRSSAPNTN
jgi:hypothetical protein